MQTKKELKPDELVGEVLTHIDEDPSADKILLTTASGRTILVAHQQDCCEVVRIEDTDGKWHKLIGRPIIEVSQEEIGRPAPRDQDGADSPDVTHITKSALTFRTNDATVISRWIGESNGYYSETPSIRELLGEE